MRKVLIIIILLLFLSVLAQGATLTRQNGFWIGANGIQAPDIKPATIVDYGCSDAWEFSDNQEESVVFEIRVPTYINLSYTPTLSIGWSSPATSADCDWELNYTILSLDEDTDQSPCEYGQDHIYTSSSTADGLVISVFNITEISSDDVCIQFHLQRNGKDPSDTLEDAVH
jgi:hypothetical protein